MNTLKMNKTYSAILYYELFHQMYVVYPCRFRDEMEKDEMLVNELLVKRRSDPNSNWCGPVCGMYRTLYNNSIVVTV